MSVDWDEGDFPVSVDYSVDTGLSRSGRVLGVMILSGISFGLASGIWVYTKAMPPIEEMTQIFTEYGSRLPLAGAYLVKGLASIAGGSIGGAVTGPATGGIYYLAETSIEKTARLFRKI